MKIILLAFITAIIGCTDSPEKRAEQMRERLNNGKPKSLFEICIMDAYKELNHSYENLVNTQIEEFAHELYSQSDSGAKSIEEEKKLNSVKLEKEIAYREVKNKIDNKYCLKEAECFSNDPEIYSKCMDYGPIWSKLRGL